MTYVKQTWENLPSENTPISAERLSHLETQYDSTMSSLSALSVRDFGALGDGIQDDTLAVQSALDAAGERGVGTVQFPPGTYRMDGYVRPHNNTAIRGVGATILKRGHSTVFRFTAGTFESASNLTISGLKFVGDLGNWGAVLLLWAHRAKGIRIYGCDVEGATVDGHTVDLQGCSTVDIRFNTFRGARPVNRPNTECIQIDHSTRAGSPLPAGDILDETFTGDGCRSVYIRDNLFLKLGEFNAPRPFGSHTVVEDRFHSGVFASGNYVEGVTNSDNWTSVVNFVHSKGVEIRDNVYVPNNLPVTSFVNFSGYNSGFLLQDVNIEHPPTVEMPYPPVYERVAVFGNDTGTLPQSLTDYEKVSSYSNSFYQYPGTPTPRLGYSNGIIEFSAVFGRANADTLTSTSFVEVATIPRWASPKTEVISSFDVGVSVSNSYLIRVNPAGSVSLARYGNAGQTNLYLPVSMSWRV